MSTDDGNGQMMSRRQLIKAGAWAAPVIVLATAAPAAATSAVPCTTLTYLYDPANYGVNDSMGPLHNVAKITVVTSTAVIVEFLRSYPNATAVNINGKILKKWDNGVWAGEKFTYPLSDCQDPELVQVDGNNTHYYGKGKFA